MKVKSFPQCGIPLDLNYWCGKKLEGKSTNKKLKLLIFYFNFSLLTFSFLLFIGCATAPYVTAPVPLKLGLPGIYHRVERKETLWRISKMYNVDLDELIKINRISDASNIEVGQLIFVPNSQKQVSVYDKNYDDFILPLRGKIITTFGQTYNNMVNKGIDIQPSKSLEVVASRSGKVVFYNNDFLSFGKTIIIEHADGFVTVYAKNSEVFVKPGDSVQRGSPIAKIGSYRNYLHFEIRKGHVAQNPNFYLSH